MTVSGPDDQGRPTESGGVPNPGHLDHKRILAYITGQADPREVLQIEDHLAACDPCVARVRSYDYLRDHLDSSLARWAYEEHRDLAAADPVESGKTTQAVDPEPTPERLIPARQVETVVAPATSSRRQEEPSRSGGDRKVLVPFHLNWKILSWTAMAAAASLAVLVGYWRSQGPEALERLLRDTSGPVLLTADDRLQFESSIQVDEPLHRAIRDFAVAGRLDYRPGIAEQIDGLRDSVVYLGHEPTGSAQPRLLTPVAETVRPGNLGVRWMPVDHAREQRVLVVSDEGDEWSAGLTPEVDTTVVPLSFLQAGSSYTWQVESLVDASWVLSEPARFHVLAESQDRQITELESALRESALGLGYVYAAFGLRTAALQQLERVGRLNPENPMVDAMFQAVDGEAGVR